MPYNQRDRAKKIEDRAWDRSRKCWVYRRTKRALDEILLEFGDELDLGTPEQASSLRAGLKASPGASAQLEGQVGIDYRVPQPTANEERAAITAFLKDAPKGGAVPAARYDVSTRDKDFATRINGTGPEAGPFTKSSLTPGIESANEAIDNGRRLGYSDADIAAYLRAKYPAPGSTTLARPSAPGTQMPAARSIKGERGTGVPRDPVRQIEDELSRDQNRIQSVEELELAQAREQIRGLSIELEDVKALVGKSARLAEIKDRQLTSAAKHISTLESEVQELRRFKASPRRIAAPPSDPQLILKNMRIQELEAKVAELESKPGHTGDFESSLHDVVAFLFPADENLHALVQNVSKNEELPSLLARKLEFDLKSRFSKQERITFRELIDMAGESNLLSQEAIDLAHMIRKQRNRLLHPDSMELPKASTRLARNLLALSAMRVILAEMAL